jgi:hypothetical protein
VYVGGILASTVLAAFGYAVTGDRGADPGALTTGLALAGQFGGWLVLIAVVSRTKGRSLLEDFGLRLDVARWWALFAGIGLFLVGVAILAPLNALVPEDQQVVDELQDATGAKVAVLAIGAALLAPLGEEVLFRGLLLRSLRRRMDPAVAVGVQALAFAFAHPLVSPSLGDLKVVPALALLGVAAGMAAVATGDLGAPILLHVGFNLISTLLLV